jgi:SSS family solute:Na+ symporter
MGLDIFVVFVYIACMLLLGWLGMRRATSREEFLVAGRNLGPGFYMGTMAATVLGGASTVGTVKLGYVYGISGFWLCAALGCGILVLNLFLAKPLLKLKVFTVTQVLERRYNTVARRTSAGHADVCGDALCHLGAGHCHRDAGAVHPAVLAGGADWRRRGGGVFRCGRHVVADADRHRAVRDQDHRPDVHPAADLPVPRGWLGTAGGQAAGVLFQLYRIGGETILTYFVIYFFGILIGQDIWQRVFTARSEGVARYAGTIAGLYCMCTAWCAAIGMATKVLLPDLAVPANAFAAMVKDGLPDGVRGLVIAAALAAMMSTASAALLAASTTLTEDLSGREGCSLWTNRIVTLLVGLLVLALAMVVSDVITALTLAYNLLVAGMLVPLLGRFTGPRATGGAIASMLLGCGTAILAMCNYGLDSNIPIYQSLVVSVLSFVLVSV